MKAELKKLFSNKAVRAATIGGLALLLLVAVWAVFFGGEKKSASAYQPTEAESRLCTVLERIEGVGGVTVLINGEEGGQPANENARCGSNCGGAQYCKGERASVSL